MTWLAQVVCQQRGTKEETQDLVSFATREFAIAAVTQMEQQTKSANEEEHIVLDSGERRISFLKRDYRRNQVFEK